MGDQTFTICNLTAGGRKELVSLPYALVSLHRCKFEFSTFM